MLLLLPLLLVAPLTVVGLLLALLTVVVGDPLSLVVAGVPRHLVVAGLPLHPVVISNRNKNKENRK